MRIRHSVITHVRPLPDPVPAERDLRREPVTLFARTWRQHPRAPRAQLDPAVPGRAQNPRSFVPASRAAEQLGTVQNRVLPTDVLGQSQRRVAKRVSVPDLVRTVQRARQPPRSRIRYSPPSATLLRTALRGVLLRPRKPQQPRLMEFLHCPYQRVGVGLQSPRDGSAECEVVVRRPEAVRSKEGDAGPQRVVSARSGRRPSCTCVRWVRKLVIV